MGFIPDDNYPAVLTLKALFSTQVASVFFPELLRTFGTTYIDLRCGFGKDFLSKGHLKFNTISSMKFIEGDKVEADLHFGCGLYVYKHKFKQSDIESLMGLFTSMSTDISDPQWTKYRSIFVSMTANIDFDFSEKSKKLNLPGAELIGADINLSKYVPLIMGRVLEFRPKFNELKVYHEEEELSNEARLLNE